MTESPAATTAVRFARIIDIDTIKEIDRISFPLGGAAEPAASGEFERGVDEYSLLVAEIDDEIVGFIHFGKIHAREFFIYGTAVLPAFRRRGVARALTQRALNEVRRRGGNNFHVSVTTAPDNLAVIAILTEHGFVGTSWLRDYFGPGKDRLYFEYSWPSSARGTGNHVFLPTVAPAALSELLTEGRCLVAVADLPHGMHYEVATPLEDERASAAMNEIQVSVSMAGTLTASFTFLFGFVLVTPAIGTDLLGATGAGMLVSLLSLLAYSNASGDLARLDLMAWKQFMLVGNVWSEFGAVYSLISLTPTLVVSATKGSPGSLAIALVATLLLIFYHRSRIDIMSRYTHSRWLWVTLRIIYSASPLAAVAVWQLCHSTWPWTLGFVLTTTAALVAGSAQRTEEHCTSQAE